MNLAKLRVAVDILKAHTRVQPLCAQPSSQGLRAGGFQTPLALGASGVDQSLDGGLACGGLHEVRCALARDIAAGAGFALGLAVRAMQGECSGRRKIVWVDDPAARGDGGGLFPAGLTQYGLDPSALTLVGPRDLQGAMWAADEAAGCAGLAAMVFQIKGNPARFDITATRRLMLRARQSGVLALILRQSGQEEASAALTRWHVQSRFSETDELDQCGVEASGEPNREANREAGGRAMRLSLTLERNRAGRTGQWLLAWNPKTRVFDHVAVHKAVPSASPAHSLHRLHPSSDRPDSSGALGQVLDHRQGFGRAS